MHPTLHTGVAVAEHVQLREPDDPHRLGELARADLGMAEEAHPRAKCIFIDLFFKHLTKVPGLKFLARMLGWVEFVVRCVIIGLRERADVYLAVDVDAFPAAWICSKLRGTKNVLYAYELYADRPYVPPRPFWRWLERTLTRCGASRSRRAAKPISMLRRSLPSSSVKWP